MDLRIATEITAQSLGRKEIKLRDDKVCVCACVCDAFPRDTRFQYQLRIGKT